MALDPRYRIQQALQDGQNTLDSASPAPSPQTDPGTASQSQSGLPSLLKNAPILSQLLSSTQQQPQMNQPVQQSSIVAPNTIRTPSTTIGDTVVPGIKQSNPNQPTVGPVGKGNLLDAMRVGITKLESGGTYTAQAKNSTASGRYQYLNGTWGGYGGYKRAADAPPAVQDQKFNEDMGRYLKRYNNNTTAAAIAWFQGPGVADKYIAGDKSTLQKTDANGTTAGNYGQKVTQTVQAYLQGK